jgi:hypothetical protein
MDILSYRKTQNIKHWDGRLGNPYGKNDIEIIDDSSGANAEKPITSIPSPFARIDLVNTAFAYCADHDLMQRPLTTIYDKIVSDSLDVGLLFFKSNHVSNNTGMKINILKWDRKNRLDALKNSESRGHNLLAKTLELYLEADKEQNNFAELDDLFFLLVDGELTGSTSPKTMFMPPADPVTKARGMRFDEDFLFDDNYCHLYKRLQDYQKYLYFYFNVRPELKTKMGDFYRYVEKNIKLTMSQDRIFNDLIVDFNLKTTVAKLSQFEECFIPLTMMSDSNCEVKSLKNVPIHTPKTSDPKYIESSSDFVIKSNRGAHGKLKPLVLANGFSKPYKYTLHQWDPTTVVNFNEKTPIYERILPSLTEKYPYLTAGDFLEPFIVEFDYTLNNADFFVVGFDDNSRNVIPPLTKTFFQYFSIDDVLRTGNSQPMVVIESSHKGYYRVKLNIPVRGGIVSYERAYEESIERQGDKGRIISSNFDLNIFPNKPSGNNVRVAMLERTSGHESKLAFYDGLMNEIEDVKKNTRASRQIGNSFDYSIYGMKNAFNYIAFNINQQYGEPISACLALKGQNEYPQGHEQIVFGVDFGTTNTHVEYRRGNEAPKPFELKNVTKIFSKLTDLQLQDNIEFSSKPPFLFLPKDIKSGTKFSFPQRTVIGERNDINYINSAETLGDVNIPFSYEKDMSGGNSTSVKTNLKWSKERDTISRIKHYIEELCLLMLNKVCDEGGDVEQTRIFYSYPSSMSKNRQDRFGEIWNNAVATVFGETVTGNIESMSEGLAPFYYYINQQGIMAYNRPVLSIDIGGGTTDVTLFKDKDPQWTTSFTFAGNALFGNGYGIGPDLNGFLCRYGEETLSEFGGLAPQIFKSLPEDSADRISFLFSLESNEELNKGINPQCFFSYKLKNDSSFKFVFVLFYSAIIYHIAQIMKEAKQDVPSAIVFSGTASKVLGLIDSDPNLKSLGALTEILFSKVFGEEKRQLITIKREGNPKEVTSKGLIYALAKEQKGDMAAKSRLLAQVQLGGSNGDIFPLFDDCLQYETIIKNESVLREVIENVESFLDLMMEIGKSKQFFMQEFGIERAVLTHEAVGNVKNRLYDYLKFGLGESRDVSGGDTTLDETLFFYPVRGLLGVLAFELSGK